MTIRRRRVNVAKGTTLEIAAGRVALEVTRFASGAVEIRNARTRAILRAFSPVEVKEEPAALPWDVRP